MKLFRKEIILLVISIIMGVLTITNVIHIPIYVFTSIGVGFIFEMITLSTLADIFISLREKEKEKEKK